LAHDSERKGEHTVREEVTMGRVPAAGEQSSNAAEVISTMRWLAGLQESATMDDAAM
jgi:hypothetical protein